MRVTVNEVSGITGIPASTVRRWAAQNKIEATKFGGTWVLDVDPGVLDDYTRADNTDKQTSTRARRWLLQVPVLSSTTGRGQRLERGENSQKEIG